jgi:hypothetical protein
MNFPEVESLKEAEFLPSVVRIVTSEQEKENRNTFLQIRAHGSDEVAMEKLHHDHPELEYFAARDIAKKKKVEATEAGPSTIDVSSSSSSELDSDFCNNFSSPDDEDWVISRC